MAANLRAQREFLAELYQGTVCGSRLLFAVFKQCFEWPPTVSWGVSGTGCKAQAKSLSHKSEALRTPSMRSRSIRQGGIAEAPALRPLKPSLPAKAGNHGKPGWCAK